MTWFNNVELEWTGGKKKRASNVNKLINGNPVLNDSISRSIGNRKVVIKEIVSRCKLRLHQYENIPDSQTNTDLHNILSEEITLALIKYHIFEMLKDDSDENKHLVVNGKVHYPPHYFVSRFREDNSLEFFLKYNKPEIYAQFYDELDELVRRRRVAGEVYKLPRPAVVIDDRDYPKVEAIPLSTKVYREDVWVKVEIIPKTYYIDDTYAIVNFCFVATTAMLHGGYIKEMNEKHVRTIVEARANYLRRYWL